MRLMDGTCAYCGRMFVDRSQAQRRRFCSDNCRKRHQDDTTGRGICVECGGATGSGSKVRGVSRCRACQIDLVERNRALIFEGYRAGFTAYEIAERTGIPKNTVVSEAYRMRLAGVPVPFGVLGYKAHRRNRVF